VTKTSVLWRKMDWKAQQNTWPRTQCISTQTVPLLGDDWNTDTQRVNEWYDVIGFVR